ILADMNIPTNDAPVEQAPNVTPPIRIDDQILPVNKWVPIGKNEQWFNLYKDLLRYALDITPTNDNNPFVAPPSSDTSSLVNVQHVPYRKNLATALRGKKKTAFLLILTTSRGKKKTALRLFQRQFHQANHPSPENQVCGKDGRGIFRMPIPDALLTDEIKGAPYYSDYQEQVAKYQQILDAERGKAEKGGATKSSKARH
ncbi:hypothetical protein Tco_0039803, partial [Tanacetum coccineum]